MRGFVLTERRQVSAGTSVIEFTHHKVPQGMAWRIDLITGTNFATAEGTMYLILNSGGVLSYLAPAITLGTSRTTQYTFATVLYEGDELYVYVTGLSSNADVEYSIRGLEVEAAKVFYRF